jgi:hypothetical protein
MPTAKLRITHLGDRGRLKITTLRQDVPNTEPHTLGAEIELDPGDSRIVAVYSGCALVITEREGEVERFVARFAS